MFEKLQELGVSSFTPVNTEFSQNNGISEKDLLKLESKMQDACKQSLCPWLIEFKTCISFNALCSLKDLCYLNANGDYAFKNRIESNEIHLAFGPEGGWSENEEKILREKKFQSLKVSQHILRMETAAITGASRLLEKLEESQLD